MKDYSCEQFPPICPICGNEMGWNSDFTLVECGYLDEDAPEDADEIVHSCHCGHCGHDADFMDKDGQQILLSCFPEEGIEEEDDPFECYTPTALDLFNIHPEDVQ